MPELREHHPVDQNEFSICRLLALEQFSLEEYDRIIGYLPLLSLHGDDLRQYVQKLILHGVVYVVVRGHDLKGMIGFYCNDCQTRKAFWSMISCDPVVRGTGIAEMLVRTMIAECRNAGMGVIEAKVVKENLRAVRFYERLGFSFSNDSADMAKYRICLGLLRE